LEGLVESLGREEEKLLGNAFRYKELLVRKNVSDNMQ